MKQEVEHKNFTVIPHGVHQNLRVCREIPVSSVGLKHKSKSYKIAIKILTEDYVFPQLYLMNHFF